MWPHDNGLILLGFRRYGYDPDALIGAVPQEIIHPEDVGRLAALAQLMFATGDPQAQEDHAFRILTSTGEVVSYWIRLCARNRDRLLSRDPNLVFAGEVIVLPSVHDER